MDPGSGMIFSDPYARIFFDKKEFYFKLSIFVEKIVKFYQFFRVLLYIRSCWIQNDCFRIWILLKVSDPTDSHHCKNRKCRLYLLVVNIAVLALPRLLRGLEAGRGTRGNTLGSNITG